MQSFSCCKSQIQTRLVQLLASYDALDSCELREPRQHANDTANRFPRTQATWHIPYQTLLQVATRRLEYRSAGSPIALLKLNARKEAHAQCDES